MRWAADNQANYWVQRGQIPLGLSENGNTIFKRLPKISDFLIISAMTRRGKSVLMRNIYWFVSKVRPILVIDWEGDDHKYSYYGNPNNEDKIAPYTRAAGIPNSVFFKYPPRNIKEMAAEKTDYQKLVVPNLNDYIFNELRGMGFPEGSALELKRIMREYGPFKDMNYLLSFIRNFPINDRDAFRKNKQGLRYNVHDTMASQSKQSLVKYLDYIIENKLFDMNPSESENIVKYLFSGKNVFLDFSGNLDLARVETARLIKDIIGYRKKYPASPAPYIFLEEADSLVPRYIQDSREKAKTEYVLTVLVQAVLRAPKHKIGIAYCTPAIINLHTQIVNNSYEKIFGELNGFDLKEAGRITNDYVMEQIRGLRFDRYSQIREFVYFDEKKQFFRFVPYACPQRYHKES